MLFKNNINYILNDNSKNYYAPIINGFLIQETCNYFSNKGFFYFSLPELKQSFIDKKLIFNFELDKQRMELNNSQAMLLTALSAVYDKVFTISKCFRNETMNDEFHLIEFNMLELELSIKEEIEIFSLIDNYLEYIVRWFNDYIVEKKLTEIFNLKFLPFPLNRRTYRDIIRMYHKEGKSCKFDRYHFIDYNISNDIASPLYVIYYPHEGNWRAKKKDQEYSFLYNLILPNGFGELVEFSIRETSLDFYEEKFNKLGYSEYYEWYLNSLKKINTSKAGLGLGLDRLGAWLMDLCNISDQLVFSSMPN